MYPNEIAYSKRPWHRLGNSLIGHPAFLDRYISKNLPMKYDYISFEKWDRMKPFFFKVTIPYFFRITMPMIWIKLVRQLSKN
jgi:cytochrome c biogenesis factor